MHQLLASLAVSSAGLLAGFATTDEIDDVVEERLQRDWIPGAVLAIEHDGVLEVRAYGVADIDEDVPMERDSVFEYSSITKGLTGTCVMRLVEQGKLSLDDPVAKHLPEAPESWAGMTVRHTLTHSHGLPELLFVLAQAQPDGRMSGEEQLALLYKRSPSSPPGSAFAYTNTGPFLAGQIIERVTGKSYDAFLKETVLTPAGMESVRLVDASKEQAGVVPGYTLRDGLHVPWSLRNDVGLADDLAWCGAMGRAEDLVRYARAFRSHELIGEAALEAMVAGDLKSTTGSVVGNGWFVRDFGGRRAIAHEGHTGTALVAFLEEATTYVLLTNLAKGYQAPFGADRGHDARGFLEAVIAAHAKQRQD